MGNFPRLLSSAQLLHVLGRVLSSGLTGKEEDQSNPLPPTWFTYYYYCSIYWGHDDEDLSGLTKLNAIVAKLATVKEKGDEKVSFERGDD